MIVDKISQDRYTSTTIKLFTDGNTFIMSAYTVLLHNYSKIDSNKALECYQSHKQD